MRESYIPEIKYFQPTRAQDTALLIKTDNGFE